ncbi:MAG: rhodanese-like domain-containing protein [Campylobacterota bacterium]|nr:rhodanese-like domain-containing protein [Campylobacterota bacterium]
MNKIIKLIVSIAIFATMAIASGDLNIVKFKKVKGMYNAKSALFLDARPFKLYQKGTIMGAVHMPDKQYKKFKKYLPADKNAKIVSFCNGPKCHLAPKLAKKLIEAGYKRVYVYSGGYPEWKKKKLPLMSLVKECKTGPKGPYKPKANRAITINGVKAYFGGEEREDGMVDQFWLTDMITKNKVPKNIQFVDVRKADQFKDGHLPGAINIPWDAKAEKIDSSKFPSGKLIVIYCNTGMMSTDARGSLDEDTAKNVLYFDANVECTGTKCKVTANEDI